jgi:hypothetical protein
MDEVCRPLLARLGTWGIRSKRVWLDRGFSRGQGIPDLLSGEWPFIRPAVQRGQQPPTAGGPTGTSALAATPQGPWPPSTLQSAQDAHVDFDLAVVCHNTRGQRGRHQREALR